MASTLDLFPTIAAAAGVAMPKGRVFDGFDLMPWLSGSAPAPRREFYYFQIRALEAIREGNWKYRQAAGSQAELFDLDLDPAEQYNVWERHRDVAGALEGQDADVCARGGGDVGVRKRS